MSLALLLVAAFAAGAINGLLGHGFSSLMVPAGLLMAPARLLNPALVLIELPLNGAAAWLHRHQARSLLGELRPFAFALLPGVALGALLLRALPEGVLKALSYGLLLLLVLAQTLAQALRRDAPPRALAAGAKARYGFATGALYGLTTVSGPTLAAYAQRRGFGKDETRAALACLRALEGALSLLALALLGLLSREGLRLAALLLPAGLAGLALGHRLAGRVEERRFQRLALRFNLLAVLGGLAWAASRLPQVPAGAGLALWTAASGAALWLFLDGRRPPAAAPSESGEAA